MFAVDDLCGVIASYATVGAALDIMTSFTPKDVYNPSFWIRKAEIETKGLMVNSDVVAASDSGWYAYYMAHNKTHHGVLLSKKVMGGVGYGNQPIIFYFDAGAEYYYKGVNGLAQYPNLDIVLYNDGKALPDNPVFNINRKIKGCYLARFQFRDTCMHTILLDEYGDLWLLPKRKQPEQFITDMGIVGITVSNASQSDGVPFRLLDRYGVVWEYGSRYLESAPQETPKIVQVLPNRDTALTADGVCFKMERGTAGTTSPQLFVSRYTMPENNQHYKMVMMDHERFVTTDRTLRSFIKTMDQVWIEESSKGRVQTIIIPWVHRYSMLHDLAFAITDIVPYNPYPRFSKPNLV